MKTEITVADMRFRIKGVLTNSGVLFPNADEKNTSKHNEYRITVTNLDSKKRRSFRFYGSQYDFERCITEMTEKSLKFAFRSFIDDAQCGTENFEGFCSELGYDQDSRRALRIYNECRKTTAKASDLGISEDRLVDVLNSLSEQGIE